MGDDESEKEDAVVFKDAQPKEIPLALDMESDKALSGRNQEQDNSPVDITVVEPESSDEEHHRQISSSNRLSTSSQPASGSLLSSAQLEALANQSQGDEGGSYKVVETDSLTGVNEDEERSSASETVVYAAPVGQEGDGSAAESELGGQAEDPTSVRTSDEQATGRPRAATLSEKLIAAQSVLREKAGKSIDAPSPSTDASSLKPPHHRSSVVSNASMESSTINPTTIYGVVVVGFNHSLGPIVDYSYPAELQHDEDIKGALPFLALPDGAHMHDEDYSCFHLYLPNVSDSTVYGISCVRQLRADELLRKSSDVTRSTVQKAVVVLANKPLFGPIRDKLGVITRAFFAQRDFEEREILEHFYHSLVHALKDEEQTDESAISMGVSVREIVWKFRMQTLTLFKLLLLQKRVMIYSNQVERLCSFQYALVSLVPLLLLNLEDAASPILDTRSGVMRKASSLRSSDRKSLLAYLGLPLHLFGTGAFFQPYLPLQQLDLLKSDSYLVGVTNSIFMSQRDCPIDVVINLDTATIDFLNPKVASLVGLTAADRKWMDEIVRTVESTWNPADPHRPVGMGYKASDDWLRSKFEEYLTSALSAVKFVDFLIRNKDMAILINPNDPSGLGSFNESWLSSFRSTPAFDLWNKHTDPVIFDLVEPKHPCEGQAHVIEDVGIRLVNGLHDLHLDEKLGPTQEAISKGIATGSEGVWKLYSSAKTELAKRQAEYRERREKEEANKPTGTLESTARQSTEVERPQLISDQVLAGAAEVGGRAATLATNIGSFFGSRLKQPSTSQSSPSPAAGAQRPSSSTGSAKIEAEALTSNRPRMGFLSSFRSPSVSAPSESLQETVQPETKGGPSASLPSPPVASTFGSFFRRSSSNFNDSSSDVGLKDDQGRSTTLPSSTSRTSITSIPDDFEDGSAVWADAIAQSRPRDVTLRDTTATNNERSSIDMMSDVKL